MHTFIPDDDHAEDWLDNAMARHQRITVDLRRYAEAMSNPDPGKVRCYIDGVNFYGPSDPIIVLARRLREGDAAEAVSIQAMVTRDANASRYGQALARGCRYARAANAFFTFGIGADELHGRLDIGKPECEP